jgi:hypothetical protein
MSVSSARADACTREFDGGRLRQWAQTPCRWWYVLDVRGVQSKEVQMVDATKPSRLMARAHPPRSCTIPQVGLTDSLQHSDHQTPYQETSTRSDLLRSDATSIRLVIAGCLTLQVVIGFDTPPRHAEITSYPLHLHDLPFSWTMPQSGP